MDERMDKTKIAKMDMETFRQLREAEDERDRWKEIALRLMGKENE